MILINPVNGLSIKVSSLIRIAVAKLCPMSSVLALISTFRIVHLGPETDPISRRWPSTATLHWPWSLSGPKDDTHFCQDDKIRNTCSHKIQVSSINRHPSDGDDLMITLHINRFYLKCIKYQSEIDILSDTQYYLLLPTSHGGPRNIATN